MGSMLIFTSGLLFSLASPGIVRATDNPRNIGSEALAVFRSKCASCHGPKLARPRGRFGYVLDLARVARNPEMVVPFSPGESELWELVRRNEMPPADSPTGPLSQEQKNVIRDWIGAGAPIAAYPPESAALPLPLANGLPVSESLSFWKRALSALGKLHVLIVHFPIALLLAAALGELFVRGRPFPDCRAAVRFCLWLAAISSTFALTLGWLHADIGGHGLGSESILRLHRWLGVATCLWTITLVVVLETDMLRGRRSILFRTMLGVGALMVAATGHMGGLLAHGEGFFNW